MVLVGWSSKVNNKLKANVFRDNTQNEYTCMAIHQYEYDT